VRLTKLGHACVRLEQSVMTLVIDPGEFSAPDALDGADAVLITHEHIDHFAAERVQAAAQRNPDLRIWTNRTVAGLLTDSSGHVETVAAGDGFSIAGHFGVQVRGEWHAMVHPDAPRFVNVGFLVDGRVFHPGDAFTLPGQPIDTLLLPVSAGWSKLAEVIDYVRAVKPRQVIPIHDGLLNDIGLAMVDTLLGERGPGIGAEYRRVANGASIELD
jgi:L-ascorbate metabolism protein UlaG (beta-lactamase superfamily)